MTAVADAPELVAFDSIVLGRLSVAATSVFSFPKGLHGFEAHTQFALVPAAREALYWLQSTTDRNIVFLLADPFVVAPGYEVDLGPIEMSSLRLQEPSDALVLAIVSLPNGEDTAPTANLRGPIVLNARELIAGQIVSAVEGRDVKTPIDLSALPRRVDGVAAQ